MTAPSKPSQQHSFNMNNDRSQARGPARPVSNGAYSQPQLPIYVQSKSPPETDKTLAATGSNTTASPETATSSAIDALRQLASQPSWTSNGSKSRLDLVERIFNEQIHPSKPHQASGARRSNPKIESACPTTSPTQPNAQSRIEPAERPINGQIARSRPYQANQANQAQSGKPRILPSRSTTSHVQPQSQAFQPARDLGFKLHAARARPAEQQQTIATHSVPVPAPVPAPVSAPVSAPLAIVTNSLNVQAPVPQILNQISQIAQLVQLPTRQHRAPSLVPDISADSLFASFRSVTEHPRLAVIDNAILDSLCRDPRSVIEIWAKFPLIFHWTGNIRQPPNSRVTEIQWLQSTWHIALSCVYKWMVIARFVYPVHPLFDEAEIHTMQMHAFASRPISAGLNAFNHNDAAHEMPNFWRKWMFSKKYGGQKVVKALWDQIHQQGNNPLFAAYFHNMQMHITMTATIGNTKCGQALDYAHNLKPVNRSRMRYYGGFDFEGTVRQVSKEFEEEFPLCGIMIPRFKCLSRTETELERIRALPIPELDLRH